MSTPAEPGWHPVIEALNTAATHLCPDSTVRAQPSGWLVGWRDSSGCVSGQLLWDEKRGECRTPCCGRTDRAHTVIAIDVTLHPARAGSPSTVNESFPSRIELARPSSLATAPQYFGCPIQLGAPGDALVLKSLI